MKNYIKYIIIGLLLLGILIQVYRFHSKNISPYVNTNNLENLDKKNKSEEKPKLFKWICEYSNGAKVESDILNEKDYKNTDLSFIDEQVEKIDFEKKPLPFKTMSGDDSLITEGTLLDVDKKAEIKYLKECFLERKSLANREPIRYSDYPANKYIEVSISNQKMYLYEKNENNAYNPVIETSVVTGKDTTKTPVGAYYITSKVPGKTLKGPGYSSWVNYWMRLTGSGIGIHDATWRGSFGGNIYHRNGSHGCVNTPYSVMKNLYASVDVGTPVYIHE